MNGCCVEDLPERERERERESNKSVLSVKVSKVSDHSRG